MDDAIKTTDDNDYDDKWDVDGKYDDGGGSSYAAIENNDKNYDDGDDNE